MKNILSLIVAITLIIVCASSCGEDPLSTDTTVSQETVDNKVAYSLNMAFSETFSQIQITPLTDEEISIINYRINSPAGGHVIVNGKITINIQTGRMDWFLNYGWWSYKIYESDKNYLTYNGLVTFSGFVNQYTMKFSMKTSSISFKGKVESKDVNESCSLDLNANFNSSTGHGTITGSECGRSVNHTF